MTIAIGALCDADANTHTANIMLCADKRITYTVQGIPKTSNPNGSKIYDLPCGFFCAIADDMTHGHIFVSKLADGMKNLKPTDTKLFDLVRRALAETAEFARTYMVRDVLKDYGVTMERWLHDKKLADRSQIQADIAASRPSVEMIVAGFDARKRPLLFYTDCVNIQEQTALGFYSSGVSLPTIPGYIGAAFAGSGGELGLYWLNFRQHTLHMSAQRTCYHLMEAKRFAEQNVSVGKETAMLFLRPDEPVLAFGYPPFPNQTCNNWKDEFWVKDTKRLDTEDRELWMQTFTQSIPQK